MVWLIYYLSMYLMTASIRLASLWNIKSKHWIRGRKNWWIKIKNLPEKSGKRIWFHVSSLGEFEQARPVMENLKRNNPAIELILTFFSPSGYLIKADYPLAHVLYLPADLPGNAAQWVKQVNPDMAVFVKYDLWAGYLKALQNKKIPAVLISAHWSPGRIFHSSTMPPTRTLLKNFDRIFFQKADHIAHFKQKGFSNLDVAGDTRMDRSLELPGEVSKRLSKLLDRLPVVDIVAGSTWPADEKLLMSVAEELNLSMIMAPHDVSEQNITRLVNSMSGPVVRLSTLEKMPTKSTILLVDSVGLLNVLYAFGRVAYVGGGFGSGIHNTLEPIAHRKPVIFGPHYQKFPEAVDLIALNGAWSVSNRHELKNILSHLLVSGTSDIAGEIAFDYLSSHSGASKKISHYLQKAIESNN